ncbi:MAG: ABC transporter substrate-binding protein [Solirubrobacterales bacterium]|nr:ABC transporter substrate-binding protein [Solirubrobacterales bacterium]
MIAALAAAAIVLSACGDDESGGPTELSFFIFNEPSGILPKIADACSKSSNGEYTISFEYLPNEADQQREQLVRRLGAEDSSIDIMGMDVIWTGEFANAGWVEEWTGANEKAATTGVFPSVAETARFEDKLWAAPIWSNTQLLWYRKDRVPKPPKTWEEMLDQAAEIGKNGMIQVQADRYEGLVVWLNSMVESAGTSIVQPDDAEAVALSSPQTDKALGLMVQLANSEAADPSQSTSNEDTARLSFEAGSSSFMLNYPFVYPSAKDNAPDVFKNLGEALYPRVDADRPSAPPLGGINLGVSSYSEHKQEAFDAIKCMIQPQNQIKIATAGGLPPVTESLYDEKQIDDVYPGFADLIRQSIKQAAPRPVTPAYQDLSLAIQRTIHPLGDISPDQVPDKVDELRDNVQKALNVEGLL